MTVSWTPGGSSARKSSSAQRRLTAVGRGGDTAESAQAELLRAGNHAAAWSLYVFALQSVAHVEHGEVVRGEFLSIEQNADLPTLAAVQVHAANAVNGLDGAPNLFVSDLGEFATA